MRYSKSKPDDFLRAKYEHMMKRSGLIGFLQILKGLEAEGRRAREQFRSLRDHLRYEGHVKDIAADGRLFQQRLR